MNWTLLKTRKFMDLLESPSISVEDLKSYIAKMNGKLPNDREMHEAAYRGRWDEFLEACLADKAGFQEKFNFIDGLGGFVEDSVYKYWRHSLPPMVFRDINAQRFLFSTLRNGAPTNTPAQLQFAKEVLDFLLPKGWHVFDSGNIEVTLCYAYYNDIYFLRRVKASGGLDFSLHSSDAYVVYDLMEFLMQNSAYDCIDFLLGSRMPFSICHVGSVEPQYCERGHVPAWRFSHVDYLASKGVSFTFDDFSDNCDFDVYRYAFERLGTKNLTLTRKLMGELPAMWQNVIERQRFDIGDYLLQQGVARPRGAVDLRHATKVGIDWGLANGFKLRIHVRNDKDMLLYAAKRGLEPCGNAPVHLYSHEVEDFISIRSERYEGMQALCETLDEEVIMAFLDAGYGEGIDASTAIEWNREALLEAYRKHGITVVPKRISRGNLYRDGAKIVIPEGVEEVALHAFSMTEIESVQLPSTLKVIGSEAFDRLDYGRPPASVVVPPSVEHIERGAFAGWQQITVYDTLDNDSASAGEKIDTSTGQRNGDAGWMTLESDHDRIFNGQYASWTQNTMGTDHEVIVRSAETGKVKYRVDMPVYSATRTVINILVSAWGRNATFHFPALDAIFTKLPNKESKIKAAINRLLWPISLEPEVREIYEAYLRRFAKAAVQVAARRNDLDGLGLLDRLGAVKPTNINEAIQVAKDAGAQEALDYLEAYQADRFPPKVTAKQKKPASTNEPTNAKKPAKQ